MDNFSSPAFLITYNINNGVQIVGHAVDPPPYSKVSAFALYTILHIVKMKAIHFYHIVKAFLTVFTLVEKQ